MSTELSFSIIIILFSHRLGSMSFHSGNWIALVFRLFWRADRIPIGYIINAIWSFSKPTLVIVLMTKAAMGLPFPWIN